MDEKGPLGPNEILEAQAMSSVSPNRETIEGEGKQASCGAESEAQPSDDKEAEPPGVVKTENTNEKQEAETENDQDGGGPEPEEATILEDSPDTETQQAGHIDIESILKVPSTIFFPMELSRHLKEKLTAVVEDNWHLTKHIQSQDYELYELRKYRDEYKDTIAAVKKESPTLLSSKVIELSKKNRDMTAQIEGMKTKMQRLMSENESMKRKLSTEPPSNCHSICGGGDTLDGSVLNTSRTDGSDASISSVNQQLNKTTTKMMEYRRQNQLLQMELRTALRALSQEVGEGTTPKTVLKEVSAPDSTWRGRQQQIIALNQKVSELQIKLAHQNSVSQHQFCHPEDDYEHPPGLRSYPSSELGGGGDMLRCNIPVFVNPSARRQVSTLQQFEKKKQNQVEKLSQELNQSQNELKSTQLEAKGSKARAQFLESQVRTLRVELDEAGIKLRSKMESLQQAQTEIKDLRQELISLREREKRHREASSTEILEANQALARERSVVVRLQKLITEKQEHLQKLDTKVARLQDDVQVYSSSSPGALESMEKIKALENQLQVATQSIHTAEKERERLLNLVSNSVGEAQQERQGHNEAERRLTRSFGILSLTDSCICRCLDAGQITNKSILEEVEEIRALVRELKAGTNSGEHDIPRSFNMQSGLVPLIASPIHTTNPRNSNSKELIQPIERNQRAATVNTHRQLYTRSKDKA